MPIRVLVADDHQVIRLGLRTFLNLDVDLELVGEARDGGEAVEMAGRLKPDVVLMDLVMPGMDGIAATAAIRRDWPDIEVIALTGVLEGASVADAVRAGAIGYLLKNAAPRGSAPRHQSCRRRPGLSLAGGGGSAGPPGEGSRESGGADPARGRGPPLTGAGACQQADCP